MPNVTDRSSPLYGTPGLHAPSPPSRAASTRSAEGLQALPGLAKPDLEEGMAGIGADSCRWAKLRALGGCAGLVVDVAGELQPPDLPVSTRRECPSTGVALHPRNSLGNSRSRRPVSRSRASAQPASVSPTAASARTTRGMAHRRIAEPTTVDAVPRLLIHCGALSVARTAPARGGPQGGASVADVVWGGAGLGGAGAAAAPARTAVNRFGDNVNQALAVQCGLHRDVLPSFAQPRLRSWRRCGNGSLSHQRSEQARTVRAVGARASWELFRGCRCGIRPKPSPTVGPADSILYSATVG
jgi:hypothetical protein